MFKIISDAYKSYLRNFPVILLYAMPLLVLSATVTYFQNTDSNNRGILYFLSAAVFLIPLVSAATDISLYQRLLKCKVRPFANAKVFLLYLVTQIAFGLFAMLPLYFFKYAFSLFTPSNLTALACAAVLNIFIGLYFLARFNILLPLIVLNKVPSLPDFLRYTAKPYGKWLAVAILVYLPYIIINYLFPCPYGNVIATNLYMFVFVCFNIAYFKANKLQSSEEKDNDPTIKTPLPVKETAKAPQKKAVAKPAPKKVTKKPASKPVPAGKKAPVKKKVPTKAPKLKPVTA